MPSTGDNDQDKQVYTIVWNQDEQPETTYVREFPPDWPQHLCQAQLAARFWEILDLRVYRHEPQVRNSIWAARRASAKAFKDMLASHRKDGAGSRPLG